MIFLIFNLVVFLPKSSAAVLELEPHNFEVSVTDFEYAAVLFHDNSADSNNVLNLWREAADMLPRGNAVLATINCAKNFADSLLREYYIDKLPDVAIFRSGNYGPYLGDVTSAENITAFVVLDSLPAVTVVSSTSALASLMEAASVANPLVIGIFLAENEKAYIEQFYFAAEQLRGVGKFVHVTAVDVVEVTSPAILLLRDEKSDAMQYDGNFQQDSIEEFILHFYNPRFAELQQQNEAGKRYTKQFFASQTVKFLLLLGSSDQADHSPHARLITDWATIAAVHNDDAIFSYSFGDVPGVSELFQLPPVTDNSLFNDWLLRIFPWLQKQYVYPIVVAYDATKKGKYLSSVISHSENSRENSFDSCTLFDSETGDNELSLFVSQVLNGSAKRILISAEKAVSSSPVNQLRQILINQLKYVFEPTSYISHVVQATGSSVEKICFESGRDVLLAVQNDNMFGCDECLQLDPLFDLLARAFAYEKRITIARINVASNELPPEWGVRTYPSLLWFPSKSKDAAGQTAIAPEPFWSGNLAKPFAISYQDRSMPHLLEFTYQIEKKTSFSKQSLRVANKNQINNMYADIESSQIQHRNEYEKRLRNFGRKIYADVLADYFFGEVVRDGHRIDVVLLAVVFILGCMMHPMISCLFFKTNSTAPYLERVSRDLDNGSDLVGEIDRHDDAMDQS